jgi:tRNA threonylcarbamoyladenosine biosynthesis protein TsaB
MTEKSLLLALDTATRWPVVALGTSTGTLVGQRQWQSQHGHAEQLLPALDQLLDETGAAIEHVGGVIIGIGPGSFTGLRIGMATAKVIAHGLGVPIVGVSTTQALARAAGVPEAAVSMPAGTVDRYVTRYRLGEELTAPRLVANTADFRAASGDAQLVAIDLPDADEQAAELGRQAVAGLGAAMLAIGAGRLAAGASDDVATLVPAYVALPRGIGQAAEQVQWSPDLR